MPIIRKVNPKSVNEGQVFSLAKLQQQGIAKPESLGTISTIFSEIDRMVCNDVKRSSALKWLVQSYSSSSMNGKLAPKYVGIGERMQSMLTMDFSSNAKMIDSNHFVWRVDDYSSILRYIITKEPAKNTVNGNVLTDGSGNFTFSFKYSTVSVDDVFMTSENFVTFKILEVNKHSYNEEVTVKASFISDSYGNRNAKHSLFLKGLEIFHSHNMKTENSITGSSLDLKRTTGAFAQNWITTHSMEAAMTGHAWRFMSKSRNGEETSTFNANSKDNHVYEFTMPENFHGDGKKGVKTWFTVSDLEMKLMAKTKDMQMNSVLFSSPDMDSNGNFKKDPTTGYDWVSGYGLLQQIGNNCDRPYSVLTLELLFDYAYQMIGMETNIQLGQEFEFIAVMNPKTMNALTRNLSKVFSANPIVFFDEEKDKGFGAIRKVNTTINAYQQDNVTIYFVPDFNTLSASRPIQRIDNNGLTAQDKEVHFYNVSKTYDGEGKVRMPFELVQTMTPIMGKLQGLTGETQSVATLQDSVKYRTLADSGIACRSSKGMYIKLYIPETKNLYTGHN